MDFCESCLITTIYEHWFYMKYFMCINDGIDSQFDWILSTNNFFHNVAENNCCLSLHIVTMRPFYPMALPVIVTIYQVCGDGGWCDMAYAIGCCQRQVDVLSEQGTWTWAEWYRLYLCCTLSIILHQVVYVHIWNKAITQHKFIYIFQYHFD